MAKTLYCWRCHMDMPMLDEEEWQQIAPMMMALDAKPQALEHYQRVTGFEETNFNALWHHRISLYGPPCSHCGKPFRTPKAKWCAACGSSKEGASEKARQQPATGEGPMTDDGPHFRNQQEKDAYWKMVQGNQDRALAQLDREDRNRKRLIWIGVIIALMAVGHFFGPF